MHPGAGRAEARSAARVDHRSVVTVHDFVAEEGNGVGWIIMEALSGATLATVIRRHGPIGTDEAWYVAWHLLDALSAVSDMGAEAFAVRTAREFRARHHPPPAAQGTTSASVRRTDLLEVETRPGTPA